MSSINNNKGLNSYLINNKDLITFSNYNNIEPSTTISLENTILSYNSNIKAIFCLNCSVNLVKSNYIKHLSKFHSRLFKEYKESNIFKDLEDKIKSLEVLSIEDTIEELGYNKYYFKELPLLFNNFKCKECFFINISRKNIRIHYNKIHFNNNKNSKLEANYIINNIPLQYLEGFKNNTKIYFIPKLIDLSSREDNNPTTSSSRVNRDIIDLEEENSSSLDNSNSSDNNNVINRRVRATRATRDLIISSYKDNYNNKEEENLDIKSLEGNKRLLSSYITKSNIIFFLENKDRNLLVNLGYRALKPNKDNLEAKDLEEDISIDFIILDKLVFNFLDLISSKIDNINLLLRQRIKSSNSSKDIKGFKDFIALSNKSTRVTYFKIFSNLLIFTIKVSYIKHYYKRSIIPIEKEYYNIVKDLEIPRAINSLINKILKTNLESLELEEDIKDFNYILSTFFIELLKDTYNFSITSNSTLNNITIAFFYINNLNKSSSEIKNVLDISKLASIFIYNSRLITISYFYYLEIKEDLESLNLEKDIESFIDTYLNNNSRNYFEFISTLSPYLLALSKEASSNKFVVVETRPNIIEANSIEYPISKLKEFFNSILRKLDLILTSKLLFISSIDKLGINFNNIEDSNLFNKVGNSLLDLEIFKELKELPYFIDKVLDPIEPFSKKFFKGIKDNSKIIFNRNKIEAYNRDINSFIEYLTLAIYLFSGGPLRGTELNTILYKNIESKDRSLFYNKESNTFTIITDYSKSNNITRKERLNTRFLPPLLSRLLVVYIVYIIPFKEYILKEHFNLEDPTTPYLLVKDDTILSTYNISSILKRESSLFFSKGLTLYSYRKIINYIIKTKFNNSDYFSSSNSNLSDNIEDKQANRSTKTSFNFYFNIGSSFSNLNNIYNLKKIKDFSILYFNYFDLLSPLDISNSLDISRTIKDKNRELDSITTSNNLDFTIDTKELESSIRKLYKNSTFGFKNKEQKEALTNIINKVPIITFINKTSSGKSLLYLLPSYIYKSNIYIIITPRVTLSNDLFNRAKDLGLNPSNITSNISLSSNLYFINIEELNTKELDNIIATSRRYNRDITIYIDEIHLFLLEANFRLNLKYFSTILKYKASLVFLSATLPNSLIRILESTLNIKGINKVIKGSSNRDNIEYRRLFYRNKKEELEVLSNTLKEIESKDIELDNKILIFINSKAKGLELSKTLGLDFIYSNLEGLDLILKNFLETNSKRALLTTSILEVGLDLPSIKYTINLDPIFSLTSIIQSSGRIRASGISFIITKEPSKYTIKNIESNTILKEESSIDKTEDFKELDKAYKDLLIIERNCLRIPISIFLDNIPIKCLETSISKCSLCFNRETLFNSLKEKEEVNIRANNYTLIKLEENLLDLYNSYCFNCLVDPYNYLNNYKHSILNCFTIKSNRNIINLVDTTKKTLETSRIIYKDLGCFNCLLPNNICIKLKEEYNILDLDNKCYFSNFIIYIIAIFFYYRDNLSFILDKSILDLSLDSFIKELLRETNINNTKVFYIIEVLNNINIPSFIRDLERSFITRNRLEDLGEDNRSNRSNSYLDLDNTFIIEDNLSIEDNLIGNSLLDLDNSILEEVEEIEREIIYLHSLINLRMIDKIRTLYTIFR
jgi:superfamily II DNA/RNA helicase